MKKLCIFGDSILKGVIFSNDGPKKYTLYDGALSGKLLAEGILAENHSRMGYTIRDGERLIEDYVNQKSRPKQQTGDSVLLGFGGNDSMFNWKEVSLDPFSHHEPLTELHSFRAIYGKIVEGLIGLGFGVTLSTIVPIDPERYLNHVSRKYDRANIIKWLGRAENLSSMHDSYNDAIVSLSKKYGLGLIDLKAVFEGNEKTLLSGDGIHPNILGHKQIEDLVTGHFCGGVLTKSPA